MPIEIADYDDSWPQAYKTEERGLLKVIGGFLLSIEHIGSTSVPGLAAKPIIDIMPGVLKAEYLDQCVAPLQELGYTYFPKYEDVMPFRRYFSRPKSASGEPGIHIHIVEQGGEFWNRHIRFRDLLRTNDQTRLDYERLKRGLAPLFDDQNEYAGAKTEFIQSILKE